MRERLLNQVILTRKLRGLLLFVAVLLPLCSWADDYPFTIGGVQITSDNISGYSGVSYDASTFTISLSNATLGDGTTTSGQILWTSSKNLTIALSGTNTINAIPDSATRIRSEYGAATLTFKKAGDAASLDLQQVGDPGGNDPSIISGFASIEYDGMYMLTPTGPIGPTKYESKTIESGYTINSLVSALDNACVHSALITSVKTYPLWVYNGDAYFQATEDNKNDVWGYAFATPPVSFAPKTDTAPNTLTLNEINVVSSSAVIYSGLDDLTIHLKGENKIKGTDNTIMLDQGIVSSVSTATLTFTSDVTDNRPTGKLLFPYVTEPISGFNDLVCNNGLDMGLLNCSSGDFLGVGEIEYGLTIGDIVVSSANYSPIKKGDELIGASYDQTTNTLTLDGATLENDVISWNNDANFTIKLKGNNSITVNGSCITTTTATTRNITFTQGDASNPCSLQLSAETSSSVIGGFANSGNPEITGTVLSWIIEEQDATNNDIVKAAVAEDYKIEVGGKKVHSGNASDVFGDGKVTYNVGSNTLTLNGATITGAFEYAGTEDLTVALNGTNSVINTGGTYALNSQAGGKFNFVKASGAASAELTATCGDAYTPPISFYSSSLGDGLYWALTTPASTSSIIITDDDSKVLLAPTIAFDANKDYFATDKIAVTRNDKDNISTDIFYTWGNAEIGTLYVDTVPKALAKYDATNQIPVENGTLRAWVGYKYGTDEYVLSLVASQAFTVKTNIATFTINGISESQSYTGSKVEPTFSVIDGVNNKTLTKETDYTVAYYAVVNGVVGTTPVDMVNVGEYQIVISGKGDYAGKIEIDFEITKANLSIVTIEAIADQNYTGSEIKPEIKVTLNDVTLTPDDYGYSVGYSNNTNVPASGATSGPTVTLTALATSKYFTEGTTKTAAFNIVPKSIEGATVTLSGDGFDTEKKCFVYNGQNQTPTVTVKDGEALLTLDTDYTLTNEGGTNAGEYTVTVTGMGNYNKTATATFTISKGAGALIAPGPIGDLIYTGDPQTLITEATPVNTTGVVRYSLDYSLSTDQWSTELPKGTNAGDYNIYYMVEGDDNYSGVDKKEDAYITATIGQANLADAAITKISFGGTDYTVGNAAIEIPYTGEAIHPTVKEVKFNDGTVTLDASQYTVSWGTHNTELSSESENAQVIITSTGKNFTAGTSTSLNFKIVVANVTITAPDQAVTYNGSAQAYTSATVDNTKATLAVAYYTKEDDRTNGSNALAGAPTDAGTYYVRVTQTNSNFTADAKNATFTIGQLSLTGAVITLEDNELEYDGTELTATVTKVMVGDIEVPAASYEVSGNKQTDPGEYTLTVTAKANGGTFTNNFKDSATATFTIKRKTAEINFPAGLTYMTYYNAQEDLYIPDGVTAYIVTGTDGSTVTVTKVTYLKAGVPLLLEKTDGSTVVMNPNDSFDGNKLVYVSSTVTPSGQEYVLYNNEFVKATGTIPVGKVYLEVDDTSAARVLMIGDDTTGIETVNSEERIVNSGGDAWYDLQGRRIDKPTKKGLYILNGKKTVIK